MGGGWGSGCQGAAYGQNPRRIDVSMREAHNPAPPLAGRRIIPNGQRKGLKGLLGISNRNREPRMEPVPGRTPARRAIPLRRPSPSWSIFPGRACSTHRSMPCGRNRSLPTIAETCGTESKGSMPIAMSKSNFLARFFQYNTRKNSKDRRNHA